MAYNLGNRFPSPPKSFKLLEPGSYQNECGHVFKNNKAPFNSSTPRQTQAGNKVWTHAIYYSDIPHHIPNATSLSSKIPRFPYEALSKEDLEDILCRCGINDRCECPPEDEKEPEPVCQAKVPKHLIIGPPPRSVIGTGLSVPSRGDRGFDEAPDGNTERIREEILNECPPFYDARVIESTAFYHGWKWSKWTSKRSSTLLEQRPGPADYSLDTKKTEAQKCAEEFRHYRRKTSKQLRFIEMVQQQNIRENAPGPATYSPKLPEGTDLSYLGPKADRFITLKHEVSPGPADHSIKRVFDISEPPEKYSHAKLPDPPFFGVKDTRFKPRKEEGPSPASYSPTNYVCNVLRCSKAPFGTSAKRWKDTEILEDEDDDNLPTDNESETETKNHCPDYSWMLKSRVIRMKPLEKQPYEPSPADLPQQITKISRKPMLQFYAPFYTSEIRFQPWFDWMPVHGATVIPGPGYYNLEKPKCLPAVHRGPLSRSPRFRFSSSGTPAPNEYDIGGGVETVLKTTNVRLQKNIDNQIKHHWEPPIEPKMLSLAEREAILLENSIKLLDTKDIFKTEDVTKSMPKRLKKNVSTPNYNKSKLLRCFLYNKQIPNTI